MACGGRLTEFCACRIGRPEAIYSEARKRLIFYPENAQWCVIVVAAIRLFLNAGYDVLAVSRIMPSYVRLPFQYELSCVRASAVVLYDA